MTVVKANRVEGVKDCWRSMQPGDFSYTKRKGLDGIRGMAFVCPCGCKAVAAIGFQNAPDSEVKWDWDGNEDLPTLTPSLHNLVCGWHGHLQAGVFVSV